MASKNKTQSYVVEKRKEQLQSVAEVLNHLEVQRQKLGTLLQEQQLLDSASKGMYEEVDKLCKKAPAEPVTELMLEQINDLIVETKALINDDRYITKLNPFVPAGDNPQLRDALFVVRQIRQGLERYAQYRKEDKSRLDQLQKEARAVYVAINYFLESGESPTIRFIEDHYSVRSIPDKWRTKGSVLDYNYEPSFDFDFLDTLDLQEYFNKNE